MVNHRLEISIFAGLFKREIYRSKSLIETRTIWGVSFYGFF